MIITAKYPGRCAKCQSAFAPGDQIEWTKGQPAKHARCAAGARRKGHGRWGASYERGVGMVCDECGEKAIPGTRCWETGMMH